jgi:hypothetical protein
MKSTPTRISSTPDFHQAPVRSGRSLRQKAGLFRRCADYLVALALAWIVPGAFALTYTNSPDQSWAYSQLIESNPNDSTYYPTTTNEYGLATFEGYVTYEDGGGSGPLIVDESGDTGYQVVTTWVMSASNQTINLVFNGDDGHSLFIDGQFVGGAGFGIPVSNTVVFAANTPRKFELADYNSAGGWGVYLGLGPWNGYIDGNWSNLLENTPGLTLNADGFAPPTNLVVNGSFEEPALPADTGLYVVPSGWTWAVGFASAPGLANGVFTAAGANYGPAEDGQQFLGIGSAGDGTLSQVVTVPVGGNYLLTWYATVGAEGQSSSTSPYSVSFGTIAGQFDAGTGLGLSWVSNSLSLTNLVAGQYALTFTPETPQGGFASIIDNVSLAPAGGSSGMPPSILAQPASLAAASGSNLTFMVAASGAGPLSYQWQFNGANLTDSADVVGSTSNVLSLLDVSDVNSGSYQAIVASPFGSVTSQVATLIVSSSAPGPLDGDTAQFDYAVTSVGYTFTTDLKIPGYVPGVDASATFLVTNSQIIVEASDAAWTSGGYNGFTLTDLSKEAYFTSFTIGSVSGGVTPELSFDSNSLTVDFTPGGVSNPHMAVEYVFNFTVAASNAPPVVIQPPLSQTNGVGSPVVFDVLAVGYGATSYQWQANGANLTDGPGIMGSTSNVLSLLDVASGSAGSYQVIVANAYGSVTSAVASLTVTNLAAATTNLVVNGSFEAPVVAANTFSLVVPFGWTWTPGLESAPILLSGSFSYEGAGFGPAEDGQQYLGLVWAGDGSLSQVVTVPVPGNYQLTWYATVGAEGQSSSPSTYNVSFGNIGGEFDAGTSLGLSWVSNSLVLTNLAAGQYTLTFTPEAPQGGFNSIIDNVSLVLTGGSSGPPPSIVAQPASLAAASGSNLTFMVAASGAGPLSYQWQWNGTNLTDSADVVGSTSNVLSLLDVSVTSAGEYDVIVANAYGSLTSVVASLTVTNLAAATTNLVVNGSFEAPVVAANTYSLVVPTGWTWTPGYASAPLLDAGVFRFDGAEWGPAEDGQQFLDIGQALDGALSQVVTVPAPGNYQLTWYASVGAEGQSTSTSPYNVSFGNIAGQFDAGTGLGLTWVSNSLLLSNLAAVQYTLTFTPEAERGGYDSVIDNVSLQVVGGSSGMPPSIVAPPASLAAASGSDVTLMVSAIGAGPLSYQWQFNGANLTDSANTVGSSSNVLGLLNVSAANAGSYQVIVGNAFGSVTSQVATLTVTNTAPNLLVNGSFENGVNPPTSWYRSIFAGDTSVEGWVVTAGRVDWTGTPQGVPPAQDGLMSVQLVGVGSGISQTFDTVSGELYNISFYLRDFYPITSPITVAVTLGGATYDAVMPVGPAYTWFGYTTTMTATSNVSTLAFTSVDGAGDGYSPFLDDVSVQAVTLGTNLVQNPGFETGDFTDWTLSGNLSRAMVNAGGVHFSGNYSASFGNYAPLAYLSQTVPTIPGHSYAFSFWLYRPDTDTSSGGTPELSATWSGTQVVDLTNEATYIPVPAKYSFQEVAVSTNTVITFGAMSPPGWIYLDDISVQDLTPGLPPAQPVPPTLSMPTLSGAGLLSFGVNGSPNATFDVLVSTNLTSWVFLTTITNVSGSDVFTVPATNQTAGFYELRSH